MFGHGKGGKGLGEGGAKRRRKVLGDNIHKTCYIADNKIITPTVEAYFGYKKKKK